MFRVLDASTRPARMGQTWNEEEVAKLLKLIQKKKSLEEIAKEHERSVRSIECQLLIIAADYHFNNSLSKEEIRKFTGLTFEEIGFAIGRRAYTNRLKEEKAMKKVAPPVETRPPEPTLADVMARLDNIEIKLNVLLEAQCLNFVRTMKSE